MLLFINLLFIIPVTLFGICVYMLLKPVKPQEAESEEAEL